MSTTMVPARRKQTQPGMHTYQEDAYLSGPEHRASHASVVDDDARSQMMDSYWSSIP